jgi:hypothetical protein
MKISREMNPALSFLYPGLTVLRSPSAIFSVVLLALLLMMTGSPCWAQSQNAKVSGEVSDESGALVPNATVTISSSERQTSNKVVTDSDGRYSFPNLVPGSYDLEVTATGFRSYAQHGITLVANETVRVDAKLQIGQATQTVEVQANASPLNFDNAVHQEGVSPETINQLPLVVSGGPRNSAQIITFLPGVNTGTSSEGFNARVNGGLRMGDEAVMDGVSMQEGTMSQSGMVAFADYAMTPDMVSEVRVMTSSYEPEYGTSTGGQIIATTKSGTNDFHGGVFEYLRNKSLNATQFTINREPGDQRPKDNEHEFGGFFGGPAKIPKVPLVWGDKHKTYFFTDVEFFRIAGGASRPTLSIPSIKERGGDFTDWTNASGNLIPIYDPATTRANPAYNPGQPAGPNNEQYIRDQFPGNVIPTNRISPMAQQFFSFLPQPTNSGALNNYLVPTPVPDSILAGADHWLLKLDHYWGDKDHISGSIWRQKTPVKYFCELPQQLCNGTLSKPQDSWIWRVNWDRTISPTLLNHFAYGYLNRNEGYGSINAQYADDLPQIPGAFSHDYPPVINFGPSNLFTSFGNEQGISNANKTTRPSHIANDLVTWVKGSHTFKFGGEYRHLAQVFHSATNEAGTFNFESLATGLNGVTSGSSVASFLLGGVDNATVKAVNIGKYGAEQHAYALHAGDTWKATSKLSINYGVRWDRFSPTWETNDILSFFDFGANPDAGNRLGRLAFAGSNWGEASAHVRYPEDVWNNGFAPRLGVAYAITDKTVIRTGYGIFYTQAFYPGWGGGMSLDGFNPNPKFASSLSGLQPAFYLDQGFPSYSSASNISSGADNGLNPQYRPKDANRRSYSQQWNFTIERRFAKDSLVSAAYVGSKGTRLPSQLLPLNVLNPSLLSMGNTLYDRFGPNDTVVDGVPLPYPGWVQQLSGRCDTTVAQALLPYPQFCNSLTGLNENLGSSTFHSLQLKVEKRFGMGFYVLGSYMWSKLITDASSTTQATANYGGIGSIISPFEKSRNKALSTDDIPQNFSLMAIYELPFGRGKPFLNSSGFLDRLVGGWSVSTTVKLTSGEPFYFRSGTCNVPSQFRVVCIPGVDPSVGPFAQSLSNFDPNERLFNVNAFQPASSFNFNYGNGQRVTSYRGFGYRNEDLSIGKFINITERFKFELRGEFFNVWNNHYFTCDSRSFGDCIPFNNDISSASFGEWNGTVTKPRNIQLVGRFTF